VGGDELVHEAHRESVRIALNELETFVQARIGSNHPAETTGKWIVAKFEHDSARPVSGYAAPQLHTHCVFFNVTETTTGETRALQPQELYRSQRYATAVYQSELASRLRHLGYEFELGKNGAPEIRGYSQGYLEASSPRRQQIEAHLKEQGLKGAGPAEIAAHRTREAKQKLTVEEMLARHRQLAAQFGNQAEHVVAQARQRQLSHEFPANDEAGKHVREAVTFARDRQTEREAVFNECDMLTDALKAIHGPGNAEGDTGELRSTATYGRICRARGNKRWSELYDTPDGRNRKGQHCPNEGQPKGVPTAAGEVVCNHADRTATIQLERRSTQGCAGDSRQS
jgi:cell division septum initiation protein DivIVA